MKTVTPSAAGMHARSDGNQHRFRSSSELVAFALEVCGVIADNNAVGIKHRDVLGAVSIRVGGRVDPSDDLAGLKLGVDGAGECRNLPNGAIYVVLFGGDVAPKVICRGDGKVIVSSRFMPANFPAGPAARHTSSGSLG
jgi:hypothetical protein